jgi:hypothetical protein
MRCRQMLENSLNLRKLGARFGRAFARCYLIRSLLGELLRNAADRDGVRLRS